MFSSLKSFLERHKRKIFITGAVLGSAYVLGRFTQWKLGEWYDNQQAEYLIQSKKQLHFDGNQKTCNTTFYSLLPGLKDAVLANLDTDAITEKLKSKPSDKLSLWEQLKITSFARTVTAVYASSLLLVLLRVQLNLLGGYMYLDIEVDEGGGTSGVHEQRVYVSDANQKRYLGIVRHFLDFGLQELVAVIKETVEGVLGSVSLKQKLSFHDVKRMLGQIRQCLKFTCTEQKVEGSSKFKISSFIIPNEDIKGSQGGDDDEDEILQRLLIETADVLESEDFQHVLNSCLDVGFMFAMEKMKPSFVVEQQDTPPPDMICSIEDDCCSIYIPLAKIIPIVSAKIHDIFSEDVNDYLNDIVSLECGKSFAANIYEAFSNKHYL